MNSHGKLLRVAWVALTLGVALSWFGCGGGGSAPTPTPANNPVPTITGLSPSSATAGAAAQTLTIDGTNFLSSSTVTFNSVAHTATFATSSQLTIPLTASDQATAGSYAVVVTNPSPGGGASNSFNFAVNNPAPAITSLSPSSATAGAAAQTLTITGTNFLSSSTLTYNGVAHTATFVSSTELTTGLSASDQATAGSYAVVVTNPPPGGGGSNSVNFTVNNPAGSAAFVLTGSLNTARYQFTATLLNNGMVLMAGGSNSTGYLASAELYNPATRAFTTSGNLNTQRSDHTATLLNNGMVLIAGGYNVVGNPSGNVLASAELYDPATGTFTSTGNLNTPATGTRRRC